MKIEEILKKKLVNFSKRYQAIRILEIVVSFLCVGFFIYLVLCVVDKFFHLSLNWQAVFIFICAVCGILGLIIGKRETISLSSIARKIDERLALKEKISTAWEYKNQRANEFVPLLIKDAVLSLEGVKGKKVFSHARWLKKSKYLVYLLIGIYLISLSSYFSSLLKNPNLLPSFPGKERLITELSDKFTKKEPPKIEKVKRVTLQMRKSREKFYQERWERERTYKEHKFFEQKRIQSSDVMSKSELLRGIQNFSEKGLLPRERFSFKRENYIQGKYIRENEDSFFLNFREGVEKELGRKMEESYPQFTEKLFESKTNKKIASPSDEQKKYSEFEEIEKVRATKVSSRKKDLKKENTGKVLDERKVYPESRKKEGGEGYGKIDNEDFSVNKNLAKGYSPLPGYGSSFEMQEKDKIKVEEEGIFIKLRSQFDRGYFLKSLLKGISTSKEESGSSLGEAFISYRSFIISKLSEERVPLSYKEQVKKYFSSLEPNNNEE